MKFLFASTMTLALAAPAAAQTAGGMAGSSGQAGGAGAAAETATAELRDATGKSVGTIELSGLPKGVLLRGDLRGLPPGSHAIHFHETGACEPPFTTAGAHFNPTKKKHGLQQRSGHHAGDLPNIVVAADGSARFEHHTLAATLRRGGASLFDKDGSTIVVHAGADDHVTDPSGNSGDRIACGVVLKAGLAGTGGASGTTSGAAATGGATTGAASAGAAPTGGGTTGSLGRTGTTGAAGRVGTSGGAGGPGTR